MSGISFHCCTVQDFEKKNLFGWLKAISVFTMYGILMGMEYTLLLTVTHWTPITKGRFLQMYAERNVQSNGSIEIDSQVSN